MKPFGFKAPVFRRIVTKGPDGKRRVKFTGEIVEIRERPAYRVTKSEIGGHYGPDKNRKLVVGLMDGDLISFRPMGTRQTKTIRAVDVYFYAIRCEANLLSLAKARQIKDRKAAARAARRQERAERRLFDKE